MDGIFIMPANYKSLGKWYFLVKMIEFRKTEQITKQ